MILETQKNSHSRSVKFPSWIRFEVTYQCNFRCKHCYLGYEFKNIKDLALADVKRIINKLTKSPLKIVFLGGEPFMRNDIFEILEYAKKRGADVSVDSNGWFLNEEAIKRLKKTGTKLNITIYGSNAKSHDYFTRPGSFDRIIQALKICNKERLNVHLAFLLTKANFNELFKVYVLARKFKVKKIHLDNFIAKGTGFKNTGKFQLTTLQFLFFWGFIRHFYLRTLEGSEMRVTPCDINTVPLIKANGDVWPCVHYGSPIGNLIEDEVEHVWKKLQSFHLADEVCTTCIANKLDRIGRKIILSNSTIAHFSRKVHKFFARLFPIVLGT